MESKNKNGENLSDLTKRFLEEVERMGVSFYNIAKSTGVQEAMFTKIKRGIQEPSKKFLAKFSECYADANMEYIYLGNREELAESYIQHSNIMAKNVYSERFLSIIDKIGLSDAKIANSVEGLDKTLMSHIRTGRQGASINVIASFCEAYPQVNANYILTGKGDMFLDTDKRTSENIASQSQKMYKDTITGKDKEIADLKAEIARMKSEIDKLTGQNEIMREQLGIGGRKASSKTA